MNPSELEGKIPLTNAIGVVPPILALILRAENIQLFDFSIDAKIISLEEIRFVCENYDLSSFIRLYSQSSINFYVHILSMFIEAKRVLAAKSLIKGMLIGVTREVLSQCIDQYTSICQEADIDWNDPFFFQLLARFPLDFFEHMVSEKKINIEAIDIMLILYKQVNPAVLDYCINQLRPSKQVRTRILEVIAYMFRYGENSTGNEWVILYEKIYWPLLSELDQTSEEDNMLIDQMTYRIFDVKTPKILDLRSRITEELTSREHRFNQKISLYLDYFDKKVPDCIRAEGIETMYLCHWGSSYDFEKIIESSVGIQTEYT